MKIITAIDYNNLIERCNERVYIHFIHIFTLRFGLEEYVVMFCSSFFFTFNFTSLRLEINNLEPVFSASVANLLYTIDV